ncbi:hypothetical protein M406DRAFT_356227 [Cryphonectria parasitica EP155]|uniref:Uncharacterized protein n=1 Tax=Cryphonectria parasitica (strain ATCC 38755 / EP155) TaxID=660469 RepID=A0A9P4Y3Y3_CRYP1|nr:uncharacterized protein M406DRAFT_356227 [Cryphonectria parasitica EP155]KAF3766186.1 hypothetical protein M406DRAFT_356227 [Cryphonectria parasitica EP155]
MRTTSTMTISRTTRRRRRRTRVRLKPHRLPRSRKRPRLLSRDGRKRHMGVETAAVAGLELLLLQMISTKLA